jgi:hypothetical protein
MVYFAAIAAYRCGGLHSSALFLAMAAVLAAQVACIHAAQAAGAQRRAVAGRAALPRSSGKRAVVAQVAAPHLAVAAPESPCTGEPALTPQFYFSGWDAST